MTCCWPPQEQVIPLRGVTRSTSPAPWPPSAKCIRSKAWMPSRRQTSARGPGDIYPPPELSKKGSACGPDLPPLSQNGRPSSGCILRVWYADISRLPNWQIWVKSCLPNWQTRFYPYLPIVNWQIWEKISFAKLANLGKIVFANLANEILLIFRQFANLAKEICQLGRLLRKLENKIYNCW